MANFEFIAVRIFEEHGVVTGAVFHAELGPLDIFPAGFADDFADLVEGFPALRPEGDAISVWLMITDFREAEEVHGLAAFCFEQTPALAALVDAKADRRQNLRIKTLRGFAIFYPKINVIEKAPAHLSDSFTIRRELSITVAARSAWDIVSSKHGDRERWLQQLR